MSEEEFDFANGTPIVKTDFTIDEERVTAWGEHDLCWDELYSANVEEFTFDSVDTKECTIAIPLGEREYEFAIKFGGETHEECPGVYTGDNRSGRSHTTGRVVELQKDDDESDDSRYTYVCSIPDCDEEVRLDVRYRQIRHDCESCGAPRTFEVEE